MPAVKSEHGPSAVIVKVEQRDLVQVSPGQKEIARQGWMSAATGPDDLGTWSR